MATKNYPIPPGWSLAAPGSARSAEAGRVGLVAVATGSVLFERGLIHLIGELPQLRFAGSVRTAEAIPSLLATRDPDIVILDVRLMDSLDDRAMSTRKRPRLVLLSPRRYACINAQRLKTHVCSVFHLESSDAEMVSTLLTVHRCRQVQPGSPACETCPAWRMIRRPALDLSARECDVFERIGLGSSNRVIADDLGISVKTVEAHRENIKAKLGLESGRALVSAAIAWINGELDLSSLPGPQPRRGRPGAGGATR